MQKIVPNIWCNGTAEEAVEFYASVLPEASGRVLSRYPEEGLHDFQKDMAGKPLTAEVLVDGFQLILINAGPEFSPNPSISFMLNFDPFRDPEAAAALDQVWAGLADGGEVLMELGEYPFSPRYGWVADRFGVTWQLILTDPAGEPRPFVLPSLMFCGPAQNRAEAAIDEYTSLFADSAIGTMVHYATATDTAAAGAVMFSDFTVAGQWFTAMDSAGPHDFTFGNGVSLQVNCADQAEVDRYWAALSAVPEAEQCGWCTDGFGVSWQIVPVGVDELTVTPEGFAALMDMKKIVIDDFPRP